jgi:hypothetical protein
MPSFLFLECRKTPTAAFPPLGLAYILLCTLPPIQAAAAFPSKELRTRLNEPFCTLRGFPPMRLCYSNIDKNVEYLKYSTAPYRNRSKRFLTIFMEKSDEFLKISSNFMNLGRVHN